MTRRNPALRPYARQTGPLSARYQPGIRRGGRTAFATDGGGGGEDADVLIGTLTVDGEVPAPSRVNDLMVQRDSQVITGGAYDVKISGDYAFVVNVNRIVSIDISDPTSMSIANQLTTATGTICAIQGDYLYAPYGNGLRSIDISTPTSLSIADALFDASNLPLAAQGIAVSGNYAYLTDGSDTLSIVDISDPTSMAFDNNLTDGTALNDCHGVAIQGNYAFVGGTNLVTSVDITDPTSPAVEDSETLAFSPNRSMDRLVIDPSGDFVVGVSPTINGSAISVDISDPTALVDVDISQPSGMTNPNGIVFVDSNRFVWTSTSSDAMRLGNIDGSGNLTGFAGGYVEDNVNGFDLDGARGVDVSGNYVFVCATNNVRLTSVEVLS